MKRTTRRVLISVWAHGDPKPNSESILLTEEWGSSASDLGDIEAELRELQSDGLIDRFTVTDQACTDLQPYEVTAWLNQYREDETVTVTCPHCGEEIERGDPPATTAYPCPACGKEISTI